MEDKLMNAILKEIESDEATLNIANVPKQLLVDSIFRILHNRLSGTGITVSRQRPQKVRSMEYIALCFDRASFNPGSMYELLSFVDGVEIYPKTDETIQINLAFYNLFSKKAGENQ